MVSTKLQLQFAMEHISILSASRLDWGIRLPPAYSHIAPHLARALQAQRVLSAICFQFYTFAFRSFIQTLYVSQIAASRAYFAACFSAGTFTEAVWAAWNTQYVEKMRKRIFEEMAVFILGIGNPLFCIIFWPGWWVLAAASLAIWRAID